MRRLMIHGAAGFVGSTLLGSDLPGSALTLVDPAPFAWVPPDAEVHRSTTLPDADDTDVLLVLAGQTDVDEALSHPSRAFTANGAIALDVAEWWRRHPGARVIYMSSDEVLGASSTPLGEDAPYRPTQPYAASKAAAEMTLRCYADTYRLDLVLIRACNLVGGTQRARKLVPTAVSRIAAGRPVPVFGSGDYRREYLAVEDLCAALRLAVDGDLPAGIYNCTSAISLTIHEVIDVVASALGGFARHERGTDRLVHDYSYAMDPARLHTYGWKPLRDPAEAITAAAREMHAAWLRGESLTGALLHQPL